MGIPGGEFTVAASQVGIPLDFRLGRREGDTEIDAILFHENGGLNPSQLDAILMSTQLDPCDFNQDTNCDGMDINLLMAEIASGNNSTSFDINGDEVVDVLDRDEWLAAAGTQNIGAAYLVGDANLDGTVDGLDFLAWNTNKFSPVSDWTGGEFTGDGNVDGQDFVTWNANKFQSSNDLAVVPSLHLGCLPSQFPASPLTDAGAHACHHAGEHIEIRHR